MSITLPKRSETQPTRLLTIAAGLLFLMSGLVLVHQVWFVDRAPATGPGKAGRQRVPPVVRAARSELPVLRRAAK